MRRPRVSILLPCYNAAATIGEALESLGRQTFDDFEVIAVDDGSGDETGELLRNAAAGDHRMRVARTPHAGLVDALRRASREATGEFLARMDADDIAHPERFARQVESMESQPDVAAVGAKIEYFPRVEVRDGARRYERWINGLIDPSDIERDMFVECPIPHPTLMVRRSAFEAAGGYRDAGWPEDYDLVLRLWEGGCKLTKVDEVLVQWREHAARLSRTDSRYSEQAFVKCKVAYLRHRTRSRPLLIWGAGPVGKRFARELVHRGFELRGFVDLDPRKIGQIVHDVPVVDVTEALTMRGSYSLAAVGSATGRERIRETLTDASFHEPTDFCAVA